MAYDALLNAIAGEVFEVTVTKNAQGYNDWTQVVKGAGATPNVGNQTAATGYSPKPVNGTNVPTAAPKSNYETPEERAKKQVYIIRQSSISNAISLLSVGQKSPPDVDKVLEAARQFEDFVFGESKVTEKELAGTFFPDSPKADFTDKDDDIPF